MRLNHPSIVHLYEFGEEQGSWFLAMEWIDGVALGKLIRKARDAGGIPAPLAVKICAQVADALHYAHNLKDEVGEPLGIVHRDVSPQNVMVSFEGSVKLLDFGIAKASFQHTKTQDGQVKGKFAYMSPQQCLGEPMDGRADVFALGVVLYESLTGRPLYHRKTQYETMRAVIEEPVPSVRKYRPDLPESLDAIVQKALQKRQEDRFESAAAMQYALEHWLATQHEVVSAPRLAEYLQGVFGEEIQRGPAVDSTPFGQSFQLLDRPSGISIPSPPPSSLPPPSTEAPRILDLGAEPLLVDEEPPRRSRTGLYVGLALLVVLLVGGGVGAWWVMRGAASVAAAAAANLPAVAATTPPATNVPGTVPANPPGTTPTVPSAGTEAPSEPVAVGAMVTFRSEPPGATVHIGDRDVPGTTPTAIGDLPVGEYDITMSLDGFADWTERVTVREGRPLEVEARLRRVVVATRPRGTPREETPREAEPPREAAPAAVGRISINTRPWSKVYVGERLLGTTPIGNAEVPSGAVRLRIVDRDGTEHTRSIRVEPGADERVFYDLSGIE